MALVERDIVIVNDMETVFNYAAIAENLPEWFVDITGVSNDGSWPDENGQIMVNYEAMGKTFELTCTVLTYNPPYEFMFEMDGMIHGTSRWVYEDEGGDTHLYVAFDYQLPGGVLGQIADKVALENRMIDKGEQSLLNLKVICEG